MTHIPLHEQIQSSENLLVIFFLVTLLSPGQDVLWYVSAECNNVRSDIMAQLNIKKCNKESIMHNKQMHVGEVTPHHNCILYIYIYIYIYTHTLIT